MPPLSMICLHLCVSLPVCISPCALTKHSESDWNTYSIECEAVSKAQDPILLVSTVR